MNEDLWWEILPVLAAGGTVLVLLIRSLVRMKKGRNWW